MSEETLDTTLDNMREVADHVHYCPACHSVRIYTAVHVAYVFDHLKNRMEAVRSVNLAEHGWHGCFACDHQWVSSTMIQKNVASKTPLKPSNVIDFQAFKQGHGTR